MAYMNVHRVTKLVTFGNKMYSDEESWLSLEFECDDGENGSITFFPSTKTSILDIVQQLKQCIDCDIEELSE
tara:strand:- start:752 stop:967 length:216 start_codon:yes stop_codon:yes gene_type:complete